MEILNVDVVEPGRTLARGVFSAEGRLIFPPGESLSASHLQALKQWGVQSVALMPLFPVVEQEHEDGQPEDVMQTVREASADRFRLHDLNDPHIRALFELAVERQGRMLLGRPGKIVPGLRPAPAFRTERPPMPDMGALLEAGHRMATLPPVFHRLLEIVDSPDVSADALAAVVATDPALTARLLRLVNSPFFGLAGKIDSISRAVVIVGTRQLVMLAMGAVLMTAFKGLPVSLVNMQSFWAHSLSTGAAARLLARNSGVSQPESFFVAGLLHDLGRLVIYAQLPKHSLHILTEARRENTSVRYQERQTLGFCHDELGAELLSSWNCPKDLVERVAWHHAPLTPLSANQDVILPAADMLSQALGYGSSGESIVPPLMSQAWTALGLSPEALMEQCGILDENMRALRTFLNAE